LQGRTENSELVLQIIPWSIAGHLQAPQATKSTDYKFEGWLGLDKTAAAGNMVWGEFQPKTWTEDDVDIKVSHCGICGSDIHTLRSGWVSKHYLEYSEDY
jgi:hypothetical protein